MLSKVNLALNVVLLVAVAFLFFRSESVFEKDELLDEDQQTELTQDTLGSDDIPPIGSNSRIVYVNAEVLNDEYRFISEKYEELEKEQMRIESQIERKMQAAENRYRELEQQAATMTPSQLEEAQIELQGLQQDITQFQEKAASDFRRKETKTQEQFFTNIRSFLKDYNADGRYDYVLTYQVGGQILLTNDSLDITEDVVRGLNAEYQAGKQKSAQ